MSLKLTRKVKESDKKNEEMNEKLVKRIEMLELNNRRAQFKRMKSDMLLNQPSGRKEPNCQPDRQLNGDRQLTLTHAGYWEDLNLDFSKWQNPDYDEEMVNIIKEKNRD